MFKNQQSYEQTSLTRGNGQQKQGGRGINGGHQRDQNWFSFIFLNNEADHHGVKTKAQH